MTTQSLFCSHFVGFRVNFESNRVDLFQTEQPRLCEPMSAVHQKPFG